VENCHYNAYELLSKDYGVIAWLLYNAK
jgi:hypothetical protein